MAIITRAADAVAHLYPFHASKDAMRAELDRMVGARELELSPKELADVCALLQLPPPASKAGARAYGEGAQFAPGADTKAASGAAGAQLKVSALSRGESIAWGDFAAGRHKPGTGYAYFTGTNEELVDLVKKSWGERVLDPSRAAGDEVVTVKVPAERFMTTTVAVDGATPLRAQLYRRRAQEEPYLRISGVGEAEPAKFAQVVLYSKGALGKNDERSTKADWEVVSIIASPIEHEPMDPVTMMRNMREKVGGSKATYSAEQLLDAIEFWSKHTKVAPGG